MCQDLLSYLLSTFEVEVVLSKRPSRSSGMSATATDLAGLVRRSASESLPR